MGFRFRKSVKICKGLKVNFSKSGASLSLGGRGHSLNVGKRSRVTMGIPGTGLSYSTSLSGHHKSHKSTASRSTIPLPNQVKVIMNDDGKIELRDSRDNIITDPSIIRKIKSTDSYKNMVQNLEAQRQQKIEEVYSEAKAENDKFIEIYKQSPQVDNHEQYIQILNRLKPQVYVRKQYNIPCPSEAMIRGILQSEAKNNVTGSFFKVGKMRKEYVESNIQTRLNFEIEKWNAAKRQFDTEEENIASAETERYNEEFNANKQYMTNLINGDVELVSSSVEEWILTLKEVP